ncbi:DUF4227 family protein [Aneurinibacillus sp. Ricciae_BoGa-3]|uniref:DUF4227 family protein n=1 Tax=Aneurinibacillus sp. Ricciae_BoGa-3 TaxID=3022697 RepID=UPI003FA4A096
MYISYRRAQEAIKYICLFLICTFIFYNAVSYINAKIRPTNPYKEPQGKAVKVVKYHSDSVLSFEGTKNRLLEFYWNGE